MVRVEVKKYSESGALKLLECKLIHRLQFSSSFLRLPLTLLLFQHNDLSPILLKYPRAAGPLFQTYNDLLLGDESNLLILTR